MGWLRSRTFDLEDDGHGTLDVASARSCFPRTHAHAYTHEHNVLFSSLGTRSLFVTCRLGWRATSRGQNGTRPSSQCPKGKKKALSRLTGMSVTGRSRTRGWPTELSWRGAGRIGLLILPNPRALLVPRSSVLAHRVTFAARRLLAIDKAGWESESGRGNLGPFVFIFFGSGHSYRSGKPAVRTRYTSPLLAVRFFPPPTFLEALIGCLLVLRRPPDTVKRHAQPAQWLLGLACLVWLYGV